MNDLVALLGLAQPLVSKHLRVLGEVGLVEVREDGRQRMYRHAHINSGMEEGMQESLAYLEQVARSLR